MEANEITKELSNCPVCSNYIKLHWMQTFEWNLDTKSKSFEKDITEAALSHL